MADDSLSTTFTTNRKVADREELDAWVATEAAKPVVEAPLATPGATAEKKEKPGILAAAGTAVKDTFLEGATNFIHGIANKSQLEGGGQQLLGVLQVLSALPAGAGAAVQAALSKYAPGMEEAEAIPGGKAGEITAAGIVNSILGAPGLILDPKMREAIAKNPIPAAEALNEPITYGQLANIVAQFAALPLAGKAGKAVLGRGKAAGAEPARSVQGEVVLEGERQAPALGSGREAVAAIPERATPEPLVTPEPQFSSSRDTRIRTAQAQGPEAYAAEVAAQLKEAIAETQGGRGLSEVLREKYKGAIEAVPEEGAQPANLAQALDTALQRSEAIVAEELKAGAVPEGVAAGVEAAAGEAGQAAPVKFQGLQETGKGNPPMELWGLTEDLPGHPKGSTLTRQTLEAEGFTVPAAPGGAVVGEGASTGFGMAAGSIDPGMLARMGLGAALGGSVGDTPEERIANAFLGIGLGAVLSKKLATRLSEAYKSSGLADETGGINVNAFRAKPSVQAGEQAFQPNYQRIRATPEVVRTMKNIHRAMKEDILNRRGPARTNDARVQEGLAMINEGKMSPERVLTLGDKEMLTDTEVTAARILSVRAVEYATEIKRSVLKGEAVPEGTLKEALAVAGAMSRNTRVAQTRIAQAQQASSIRVSGERVGYRPEDVVALADEMLPGMSDKQIAAMMGKMTPEQAGQAVTFWSLFPRMALEGMYFSYLSGKAIPRNFVGNGTMMALAIPERGIARFMPLWGSKLPGVVPGEATQMARAFGGALSDQIRMLRHVDEMEAAAAKMGLNTADAATKSDRRAPALTADNLQALGVENPTLLVLGQATGDTLRFPGAVLEKTDVGSKTINGTMMHRIEAFRQATFEGLVGEAFEARVGALMDDVTKLNQSARQRIVDFADEQTLTKKFESDMMNAIARGPENEWLNLVYRGAIMPFFRVIVRMTEQTMIRMPGLNFLAGQFWKDWNAGGTHRQVAQARLISGAAVGAAFMYVESQGGLTGNRPKDPKLAALWDAAGHQARSFWDPVSEKWRSYDGLGPLTSLIAGAADTSMTIRRLPEADAVNTFFAYLMSQIDSLDSRTFTQSISNFKEMLQGSSNDTRAEQAMTFLRRQVAGWLKPGVVRELETLSDPEVRRVIKNGSIESAPQREFQQLLDEMRAGWPGFSSERDKHGNFLVPPSRNLVTGEPTIVESWPFNPFPGRTPKDIPVKKPDGTTTGVFQELLRLRGAGIDELPDWIAGGKPGANVGMSAEDLKAGIRLTPQEKDRWVELMTQVVKPLGGTYAQALKAEMESDLYWQQSDGQRGTDGGKAGRLQLIERAYRVASEMELHAESPKLAQAIIRRTGERAINKAPTAQQPDLRQMFEGMLTR